MLANRTLLNGTLKFIIDSGSLTAVFEEKGKETTIPAEAIKYIPTALVAHLRPENKDKLTPAVLAEKNAVFTKFLSEHQVALITNDKGTALHFAYSQSTYYSQVALSLAALSGSFATGGLAAPLLFAAGTSALIYTVFQPCQDLDWSSFALEGSVGAATSAATLGLGTAAQGARTLIKAVDSPVARQALHFGLNGLVSVGGKVIGSGTKALVSGNPAELSKISAKSIVSTVVAAGAGGYAGAVAGKASALSSAIEASKATVTRTASLYGLAAGGLAGIAGASSVEISWNAATGKSLTEGLGRASFEGAMVGATVGSGAGNRVAAKTYDERLAARVAEATKAQADAEAHRGASHQRSALELETEIQKQGQKGQQIIQQIDALDLEAEDKRVNALAIQVKEHSAKVKQQAEALTARREQLLNATNEFEPLKAALDADIEAYNRLAPQQRTAAVRNEIMARQQIADSSIEKLNAAWSELTTLEAQCIRNYQQVKAEEQLYEQARDALSKKIEQGVSLVKELRLIRENAEALREECTKRQNADSAKLLEAAVNVISTTGSALKDEFLMHHAELSIGTIAGAVAKKTVSVGATILDAVGADETGHATLGPTDTLPPSALSILPTLMEQKERGGLPPAPSQSGPSIGPAR